MARGKKGIAAARRHGEQAVASTTEMYQRKVAKLTAENQALKQRLVEKDSAHSREVRSLKAAMREGMSPELVMTRRELQTARDEAQRAKQVRSEYARIVDQTLKRLCQHVADVDGLPGSSGLRYLHENFPEAYNLLPENIVGFFETNENTPPMDNGYHHHKSVVRKS